MDCFPLTDWRLSLLPPCSTSRVAGVNYLLLAVSLLLLDSSLELSSVRTRPFTLWGAGPLSESDLSPMFQIRAINWYLEMFEISLLLSEESSSTTSSLDSSLICKSIVAVPWVPAYPYPGCSWIVLIECSPSISYSNSGYVYSFFFCLPLVLMWAPYLSIYHALSSSTSCRSC